MDSSQRSSRDDGRKEVIYGVAWLATALFCFVWAGFDWVVLLVSAVPVLTEGRLLQRWLDSETATAPGLSRWRVLGLLALLFVLIVLAAARAAAIVGGTSGSAAGSEGERWLPLVLSAPIPLWFFASGFLHRMPRHALVGAIGLAGALAGPLLGLAWWDSLALAAVVFGLALLVTGATASYRISGAVTDGQAPRRGA